MPFLRLTRDRRGFENTYLMHADRPGDRARILYWYRTAPGIMLGRPALDEDAIRAIEDQHPDIEFDWPAILALGEVMTPEDEAPAPRSSAQGGSSGKKNRRPRRDERPSASAPRESEEVPRDERQDESDVTVAPVGVERAQRAEPVAPVQSRNRLVEDLAGREIGARLRGRHAEIVARINSLEIDGAAKDALSQRAAAIDPELWTTPESVLEGVRNADALFDKLKGDLGSYSSRE